MKYAEHLIHIENEELVLNNLRALYWKKQESLIVSDIHIGKTAHFRRHGIPVSADVQKKDLERLSFLLSHYEAKKLIVVGDLFHAELNSDMEDFSKWRKTFLNTDLILVKGNHDRQKARIYNRFAITCFQKEMVVHPFKLVHEPKSYDNSFSISGHIHPGVLIKVKSGPKIKLPCFQITKKQMILPAFSEFTGLNTSFSKKDTTSYAFTDSAFYIF